MNNVRQLRAAAPCSACRGREAVRAKLEESSAKAWTVAVTMVSGWLWQAFGRQPTRTEIEAGREEFWAWLAEQAEKRFGKD